MGLFKIAFDYVGFQMFWEDGRGLCCPSIRGKLVPPALTGLYSFDWAEREVT